MTTEKLFMLLRQSRDPANDWETACKDEPEPELTSLVKEIMRKKGKDCAEMSEDALISRSFGYQIISGIRVPSRDIVLRLALSMGCDLTTTQRLLTLSDRGILYPRKKRDAVLISAIIRNLGVEKTDELLRQSGLEPII